MKCVIYSVNILVLYLLFDVVAFGEMVFGEMVIWRRVHTP